jgi:hypothetical protein
MTSTSPRSSGAERYPTLREIVDQAVAEPARCADTEPLRCVLDIDLDGTVSVTLLDDCTAEDAHYACGVVTRCDPDLDQLVVRHRRTCCHHDLGTPPSGPTVAALDRLRRGG